MPRLADVIAVLQTLPPDTHVGVESLLPNFQLGYGINILAMSVLAAGGDEDAVMVALSKVSGGRYWSSDTLSGSG